MKVENKINKKEVIEFLKKLADIKPSEIPDDDGMCYYSKFDGSYFTRVSCIEQKDYSPISAFLKFGITDQIQSHWPDSNVATIGFNPAEKKWYGWSHRAIFGFGVGSTCKKGDCHYQAANKLDYISNMVSFWLDPTSHKDVKGFEATKDGQRGAQVTWVYSDDIPNEKLRGTIGSTFSPFPEKFGRGEWTAKTLKDAKQMAIDFAEGVS